MDKATQKKINKRNRSRGGAFEKRCADILDMDVVPYSGSNSRFGFGDIRDTMWLGECKNITSNDGLVTLQQKWFTKNCDRALNINHIPFLAFMQAGRPDKYIVIERSTFADICLIDDRYNCKYHIDLYRPNATNMIIDLNSKYIADVKKGSIVCIKLRENTKYIMNIYKFKEIMNKCDMKGVRQTDGL